MAIAGFVLSILSIWVLGIIFSGIGLSRANRPELAGAGRGLAVAGLVIGILWGVVLIIVLAANVSS
jgi:hypothetical protein